MIATDMDGTLLSSANRISIKNREALQEATRRGIHVTLATGRMYASALPYAKELGIDAPLVTYNGALVKTVTGKELFSSCLESTTVQDVARFCLAQGFYVQIYANDVLYFAEHNEKAHAYEKMSGVLGKAVGKEGMLAPHKNIYKVLVITDNAEETALRVAQLSERFGDRVDVTRSSATFVEIIAKGTSKAAALTRLASHWGLSMQDALCLGDSYNDVPMLKAAGLGIAMGNALPEIQQAAKHVTGTADADGVAEAIWRWALA